MVRVKSIELHRRELPLVRPLATARGTIARRTVWVVLLRDDAGREGWGEASPLPGFGGETGEACAAALATATTLLTPTAIAAWLDAGDPLRELPLLHLERTPCARCAVESALVDLLARRRGLPIARLLNPASSANVPVNALADDPASATAAVAAGFTTVKIKVAGDPLAAAARVAAIRAAVGSGIALRTDANGGWDDRQARIFAAHAPSLEFLEQPVAHDLALCRELRQQDLRIALDESIRNEADLAAAIAANACDVVVLKPQFLGGWQPTRRLIVQARNAGLDVVLTSVIDGSIGRAYATHLAAAAHLGNLAHGLATGDRLETELTERPLLPRNGTLTIPDQPGLGLGELLEPG